MAATPPDQPTTPSAPPQRPVYGSVDIARLPIPGNAELVVYLLVWIILAIIWAASDVVTSDDFTFQTVILTFGYMLSRGIAKASRVLEQ
jgi:hypothetical protein